MAASVVPISENANFQTCLSRLEEKIEGHDLNDRSLPSLERSSISSFITERNKAMKNGVSEEVWAQRKITKRENIEFYYYTTAIVLTVAGLAFMILSLTLLQSLLVPFLIFGGSAFILGAFLLAPHMYGSLFGAAYLKKSLEENPDLEKTLKKLLSNPANQQAHTDWVRELSRSEDVQRLVKLLTETDPDTRIGYDEQLKEIFKTNFQNRAILNHIIGDAKAFHERQEAEEVQNRSTE